ncbi:MAG: hypothetical protein KBT36_17305 [Kurthia sp.]|nr:hypothetical protein [Candidatus Kurthia equi]
MKTRTANELGEALFHFMQTDREEILLGASLLLTHPIITNLNKHYKFKVCLRNLRIEGKFGFNSSYGAFNSYTTFIGNPKKLLLRLFEEDNYKFENTHSVLLGWLGTQLYARNVSTNPQKLIDTHIWRFERRTIRKNRNRNYELLNHLADCKRQCKFTQFAPETKVAHTSYKVGKYTKRKRLKLCKKVSLRNCPKCMSWEMYDRLLSDSSKYFSTNNYIYKIK